MFQSPIASLTNSCRSTGQRGELSLASICAALCSQWHLQTRHSSTAQQESSSSHSQDVFIHYSAGNRQGTQGTSWQANKLRLTSLSKFHFNVRFLASLRVQSLLKFEFGWPDFSLVGFPMSKYHVKAEFTSRKSFTSLLIVLPANMQRGNNPSGHLPSSQLLEEHALLGNAKCWCNCCVCSRAAETVPSCVCLGE